MLSYRSVADCAVRSAHLPTEAFVDVMFLSEKGERPYKLEATADAEFKKGQLCLVPHGGSLLTYSDIAATEAEVLGPQMTHRVPLTVRALKKASQPTLSQFLISSPLYEGQRVWNETPYVAPFWAVPPSPGGDHKSNMECEVSRFATQGFQACPGSCPKLPVGKQYTVEFPVLRNVAKIHKGDVLTAQPMF